MASVVVTNLTDEPIYLSDFYASLDASGGTNASRTFTRSPVDLARATALQSLVADESVSIAVTLSDDEIASGLLEADSALVPEDFMPVAATEKLGTCLMIRVAFTALTTGTADDVTVWAVDDLPVKFRILRAWLAVSAAVASSTITIRTRAAGAGTLCATFDSGTAAANVESTAPLTTVVVTPGALEGLFIRRSDRAVAGELLMLIRREE